MAWMKLETSVARNRKFVQAGPAPAWLWVCGLAYCQEGLTDGFIPAEALKYLGVKNPGQLAHHLVAAGLWDEVEGGWEVHDYLEHNRSASDVDAIKSSRAAGGHLGGRPRKNLLENLQHDVKVINGKPSAKPSREKPPNLTENPSTSTSTSTSTEASTESKCAEPQRDSTPPLLIFPTVGPVSTWGLSSSQLAEWQRLFPNIDVMAEIRKSVAWCQANPSKRKTAKGMPRFLVNWLSATVDNGRRPTGPVHAVQRPDINGHVPPCATWTECNQRAITEGRATK